MRSSSSVNQRTWLTATSFDFGCPVLKVLLCQSMDVVNLEDVVHFICEVSLVSHLQGFLLMSIPAEDVDPECPLSDERKDITPDAENRFLPWLCVSPDAVFDVQEMFFVSPIPQDVLVDWFLLFWWWWIRGLQEKHWKQHLQFTFQSAVRLDWLAFVALRRTVTGIVSQTIIYANEGTKQAINLSKSKWKQREYPRVMFWMQQRELFDKKTALFCLLWVLFWY